MRRIKLRHIFVHKCDWCNREIILNGQNSDPYVVNAERKYFCIEQTPGKPAERDCMTDYLNHNRRVGDDKISRQEKQKEEEEKEKQKEKEKKITAIHRVLAKAEAYPKHHQR